MSEEEGNTAIRRILVAMDASPHSLAALETAAELAANLDAELLGLFVEDVNLLRAAKLPFAHEIGLLSRDARRLDVKYVERQLRVQASQAYRAMTRTARRTEISWSFQVTRGPIDSELLEAAKEADLLILGRTGRSLIRHGRLGSTARVVSLRATCQTLILQPGSQLSGAAAIVYDGSSMARRAVSTGVRLLRRTNGQRLLVLLLAERLKEAQALKEQIGDWLQEQELDIDYRHLPEANVKALSRIVEENECGILVLPGPNPQLREEALSNLLEKMECPVLLVR